MADLERIKRNLEKLKAAKAPAEKVLSYLRDEEKLNPEQIKKLAPPQAQPRSVPRAPFQFAGSLFGGALGAGTGLAGGPAAPATVPAGALFGGALGSELGGQTADVINAALGNKDPRSTTERMKDAGWNVMTDIAVTGPIGKAAELTGRGLKAITATRPRAGGQTAADVLADLESEGIPIADAAGMASGNKNIMRAASGLRQSPGGAEAMQEATDKMLGGIKAFAKRTFEAVSPAVEKAAGGDALRAGIKGYEAESARKIGEIYKSIPGVAQMPIPITSVKMRAGELARELGLGLGDNAAAKLLKRIVALPDAVPFEQAQALRSDLQGVGRQLLATNPQKAAAYGKVLGNAMDDAIDVAGNNISSYTPVGGGMNRQEAVKVWRTANAAWKRRAATLELVDKIAQTDTGEAAYNLAKDHDRLKAVMSILPKPLQRDFIAVKIQQIGMETKGQGVDAVREFNPITYLSNWREIPEPTKDLLFNKVQPGLRDALDKLARIAGNYKEAGMTANTNNTSGSGAFLVLLRNMSLGTVGGAIIGGSQGGMAGAISGGVKGFAAGSVATGGEIGMQNAVARLMTNEAFVRWIASASKINPNNWRAMAQQVTRLGVIAAKNREIEPDITSFIEAMGFRRTPTL